MLAKDSEFLKREAAAQIREAQQDRQAEMLATQKAKDAETIAPDAGFDTTSAAQQLGRPMLASAIQAKLKTLNPSFIFERSVADPSKMGIYVFDGVSNMGTLYAGRRFVMGMEAGMTPEFSIRENDGKKITSEIRGWRTVLVRLIRERLIARTAAENAFHINTGRESENWMKYVN
jgi:hypothetical protein